MPSDHALSGISARTARTTFRAKNGDGVAPFERPSRSELRIFLAIHVPLIQPKILAKFRHKLL